jgi:hypothetical protein
MRFKISDHVASREMLTSALRSAEVEGMGVAARVIGAEGCKTDDRVRNVPYLVFSSAGPDAVDRPVEG